MQSPDVVSKFKALSPEGRRTALSRMSDESKTKLLEAIKAQGGGGQFADVHNAPGSGFSTFDDTGIMRGIERGVGGLVDMVRHPLDTLKGIAQEANDLNNPYALYERAKSAMERARQEPGGDEGLHPYMHGALALLPFGAHTNELVERSNDDFSGAVAQAATEIKGPQMAGRAIKGGVNAVKNTPAKLAEKVNLYSTRGAAALPQDRALIEQGALDHTLRESGVSPIKQRAADVQTLQNLKNATAEYRAVRKSIPVSTTVPKSFMTDALKQVESQLKGLPTFTEAKNFITAVEAELAKLPGNANFHQFSSFIDDLAEGKKYTPTTRGDATSLRVEKALIGKFRELERVHAPDPKQWEKVNANYSAAKTMASVVERRRPEVLGKAGDIDAQIKVAAGPIKYKKETFLGNSAADDMQVMAMGDYALGGAGGGAAAEAVHLGLRQRMSPGFNRFLASGADKALRATGHQYSDFYPAKERPISPLGQRAVEARGRVESGRLLAPMRQQLPEVPQESFARGVSGEPGTSSFTPIPLQDPLGMTPRRPITSEPSSGVIAPSQLPVDPSSGVMRTFPSEVNQPEMMRGIRQRTSTAEMLEQVRRYLERNRP